MHEFQNNLAQLFIWNICSGRLKLKVILEGQTIEWSLASVNIINWNFLFINIKKSLLSKHDVVWLLSKNWGNQFFTCLLVTKANSGLDKLSLDDQFSFKDIFFVGWWEDLVLVVFSCLPACPDQGQTTGGPKTRSQERLVFKQTKLW